VKIPFKNDFPLSFEGESKRGKASLKITLPLPLIKGKGIKGMGLINIISGRD